MNNTEIFLIIIVTILIVVFFYGYLKMLQKIMDKKFTKEKIHNWKDKKLVAQYKNVTKSSVILTFIFIGGPLVYFIFRNNFAKRALLVQQELIERDLLHGLNGWESLNEKN